MSGSGRIVYHLTRSSGPSGGIKIMLEHVEALRAAGFNAVCYVKSDDQRPTAFETTVPILTGAIGITPDDVVIRPETLIAQAIDAAARGGLRQAVFVQNHHYCRHSLGNARCYADLGVELVFCASHRIKRFLEDNAIAKDVPVVPCALTLPDTSLIAKQERIAVMPRKRPFELPVIQHLLGLKQPELSKVPWSTIEDHRHCDALGILAGCSVFLCLQRFEGFGLPALEAMAAGCLVSGFLGDGASDYATAENGSWVPEDDLEAATTALAADLHLLREDPVGTHKRIRAGRITAARYDARTRNTALFDVVRRLGFSVAR